MKKSDTYSANGSRSPQPSLSDTGQTASSGATLPSLLPTPKAQNANAPGPSRTGNKLDVQTAVQNLGRLSRAASPANPSAMPDEEKERQMTATSGRTCLQLSKTSDPNGSSLRTCVASLLGTTAWYSRQCALTWKTKVTKSNRLLFQLSPSVRRTEGIGSGSSGIALTPTTRETPQDLAKFKARMEKYPNGTTMPNLATQVDSLIATPNTLDSMEPKTPKALLREATVTRPGRTNLSNLRDQVAYGQKMPTPEAIRTGTGTGTGKKLRLQPAMTQWMQGFPIGWTILQDKED